MRLLRSNNSALADTMSIAELAEDVHAEGIKKVIDREVARLISEHVRYSRLPPAMARTVARRAVVDALERALERARAALARSDLKERL